MRNTPNSDPSINGKYYYSESLINANNELMIYLTTLRTALEKYDFLRDSEKEDWNDSITILRQRVSESFKMLRYIAKQSEHPRFAAIDTMFDLSRRLDSAIEHSEYSRALRLSFILLELDYIYLLDDLSWEQVTPPSAGWKDAPRKS